MEKLSQNRLFPFHSVRCQNISICTVEITQYALKGQKLLAQGIALGIYGCKPVALYGQKLSKIKQFIRLLPLQGVLLTALT